MKHLWAVGYDTMELANEVRDKLVRLGWVENRLILAQLATEEKSNEITAIPLLLQH